MTEAEGPFATDARSPAQEADLQEVLNYLSAMSYGQAWVVDQHPVNLHLIRGMHAELMRGVRGEDKHPGAFRLTQVFIGDRVGGFEAARYVPPPPEQVQPLMDDLLRVIGDSPMFGALVDAALVHYQFEAIHPFEDGNGRLGRLLMPLILMHRHVLDRPLLYMSSYFEHHRDQYVTLLSNVSKQAAWEDWILFFLEGVRSQAEDSLTRIERALALHSHYRHSAIEASASKTALLALDLAMERVFVSVGRVVDYAKTTKPTAKSAIDQLVKLGILEPAERVRGAQLWVARELLATVYEQ